MKMPNMGGNLTAFLRTEFEATTVTEREGGTLAIRATKRELKILWTNFLDFCLNPELSI